MRTKKLKTSKTAMLLSVCAAMAFCINLAGSCSADDEDVYYGDELKTRAKATRSESPEESSSNPKSCGIWCVATLAKKDYNQVEDMARSRNFPTDESLQTSQILTLAQDAGVGCTAWATNYNDPDTVANLIRALAGTNGTLSHAIVGYDNHYCVAVRVKSGDRLEVKDPQNNGGTSNRSISDMVAIIY